MARDTLSSVTDDSLALRMVEIVRRRKLIAAAACATILAAAASFALYLPDLYRATALVLVERTISESIIRTPVSGELESRLYVIKQEILSRDRLTELIDRFNLYPALRQRAGSADVLSQARNDIVVEPAGPEQVSGRTKTVSFTLSYTGDNRDTVAEVTNAVAAFYVRQNDRMRSDEAIHTTQFLRTQLADAKKQLDRHETAMRDYTARYTGELPQQVGVNLATLERLNTQLRLNGEQQIRIIEQRDRLFDGLRDTGVIARVAAGDADVSPVSLDRLRVIDEQKQKLSQAETQFTARHPDVVRLREQLAAMEREHEQAEAAERRTRQREEAAASASAITDPAAPTPQFRRRTMESLEAELTKLRLDEGGVRQTIGSFEQRLESSPQRQQEYQTITRDYNAAKDLYDSLLRRYDEAQLTESMETDRAGERFRVLEPALPPEGPAAPNRIRLLVMGLLLACAGAAAAVLAREQFDTGFHTVDDVRAFTTVPVLVSIPPIGPVPTGRRMKLALATVSTLAAIALIAATVAYLASRNGQLVRMIAF
jgi:polysaccharide chain length determinant protein (PEP-CTERM system associated)